MDLLSDSIANYEVDNNRVMMFDEIAFMCGKWKDVKNKPLASAVSISSLSGQVIGSPIIVGGEYCLSKAQSRGAVLFNPPPIPKCFGLNDIMKEMIEIVNLITHRKTCLELLKKQFKLQGDMECMSLVSI